MKKDKFLIIDQALEGLFKYFISYSNNIDPEFIQLKKYLHKLSNEASNFDHITIDIIYQHTLNAVKTGDIELTKIFMDFNKNHKIIDEKNYGKFYEEALIVAIKIKNQELIEFFLAKEDGFTTHNWINICMQACQSDLKTFALLYFNGMQIPNAEQAIHTAIHNQKEDIAQCLIHAFTLSKEDLDKYLLLSATQGLKNLFIYLVENKNVKISEQVMESLINYNKIDIMDYLLIKEKTLEEIKESINQYKTINNADLLDKWLNMQKLSKELKSSNKFKKHKI